jgi:signal recognition particle subunit SRP54
MRRTLKMVSNRSEWHFLRLMSIIRLQKTVISDIKARALGQEVMQSLTPGQQVIKIVYDEFTRMMGSEHQELDFGNSAMGGVMLVGLQGSGKTTTAGKLGLYLRKQGRKPFLVPVDVYRPAAIDQLKKIGTQLDLPVFDSIPGHGALKDLPGCTIGSKGTGMRHPFV